MPVQSASKAGRSRPFSLLALASILLAAWPLFPALVSTAAAETTVYEERWESLTPAGWSSSGTYVGQDCLAGASGCSLVLDPKFSNQPVRTEAVLGIPFGPAPYNVSFFFRHGNTNARTEGVFTLEFPTGGWAKLDLTSGYPNNRVALSTQAATAPSFATHVSGAWHEARLVVDHAQDKVRAELRAANGSLLGSSSPLAIPAGAAGIGRVSFEAVYTGNDPLFDPPRPIHVDELRVITASAPEDRPLLAATAGPGIGEITLAWTAPSDDGGSPVTNYTIWRGNASGSLSFLARVGDVRTYTDAGLGNGSTRHYHVRAENAIGESQPSGEANATTFSAPGAPAAIVATPGVGVGEVRLSWRAPDATGGAPLSEYRIYRGATAAALQPHATVAGSVRAFADPHVPNGTVYAYAVSAVNLVGEGPQTAAVSSAPRPDHAYAPVELVLSPSSVWPGEPSVLEFAYDVAVSQCAPGETCPVVGEWKVLQQGDAGGEDAVLASGTHEHPGHAERATFRVSRAVQPFGAAGTHLLKVEVNARQGSTQWNATTLPFVMEQGEPGRVFDLLAPILNVTVAASGDVVHVDTGYTAYEKRCGPASTCPVVSDWRLLLGGAAGAFDGTLLAAGSNEHPAHGTNESFALARDVTIPDHPFGPTTLKLAVRSSVGNPWQVVSTPITINPCAASAAAHAYVTTPDQVPAGYRAHPRTLTLDVPGYRTNGPLTAYNACPDDALDPDYELGLHGVVIDQTRGLVRGIAVSRHDVAHPVPFIVGSDLDGDGVVGGGSALDCVKGPFLAGTADLCPPDVQGRVGVFVLDDPRNPFTPPQADGFTYPWYYGMGPGGVSYCRICFESMWYGITSDPVGYAMRRGENVPNPSTAQFDPDQNGYGGAWEKQFSRDELLNLLAKLDVDVDGDNLTNIGEFRWDTLPIGPIEIKDDKGKVIAIRFPNARDFDNDSWLDGDEQRYWNNETNDPNPLATEVMRQQKVALQDSDKDIEHFPDGDGVATVHDDDVDNDGLLDGFEYRILRTFPEHPDSDCALNAPCAPPGVSFQADANEHPGDQMRDDEEYGQWKSLKALFGEDAWNVDFDEDGLHGLIDPDSDGDEVVDGLEFRGLTPTSAGGATSTHAYDFDFDNDGLLDGNDVRVASSSDPRWDLFKESGIVYQIPDGGGRLYLGEVSQATDPRNPNTNGVGGNDGEEAPGTHPASTRRFEEEYESLAPNAEIELHPTVDGWLHNNVENARAAGQAGLAALPQVLLFDRVLDDPSTLSPVKPEALVPFQSVDDLLACVPGNPGLGSVEPIVDCAVGVAQAVVLQPLQALASEDLAALPGKTLDAATRLGNETLDRLAFVKPVLQAFDTEAIVRGATDMGWMPGVDTPWDPRDPDRPVYGEDPWSSTPFPAFFSNLTHERLDAPQLFDVVARYGRNEQVGLDAIGTVDGTHFNAVIQLAGSSQPVLVLNRPLGTNFVHLDNPDDLSPLGADLVITAEYRTGAGLTQEPVLNVQDLTLGGGLKAAVSVFMQVPNLPYVVGLGNDARADGLPTQFEFSLGTNALQQTLDQKPVYTFSVKNPAGSTRGAKLMASYMQVDTGVPYKRLVPGNRSDLGLAFPRLPSLAEGTLAEGADAGTLDILWTSPGATTVSVAARAERALADGSPHSRFLLGVNATLPAQLHTTIRKSVDGLDVQHAASDVATDVVITWEGYDPALPAAGMPSLEFQGGVSVKRWPRELHLTVDTDLSSVTYSSDTALGETLLHASQKQRGAAGKPPCVERAGASYLSHVQSGHASCTTASISGLKTLGASFATPAVSLAATRDGVGGAFSAYIDNGAIQLYAETSVWPTSVNVTASLATTSWQVASTMSHAIGTFSLAYSQGAIDLEARVLGLPTTLSVAADFPSGTTQVTSSASTPIADVLVRYGDADSAALGPHDGVVLKGGFDGRLTALALRLREFRSATFHSNVATGFTLDTDSGSDEPFRLRWDNGTSWIRADLPKLPKEVDVSYQLTDALFDFHYGSSEKMMGAEGSIASFGNGATLYLKVEDLPNAVDVDANFGAGSVLVTTSEPIGFAEVSLTGPDAQMDADVPYDNYLKLDRTVVFDTPAGPAPEFHVRVHDFSRMSIQLANDSVEVDSTFSTQTPGTLRVRYVDQGGWVDANVTSQLPPQFSLDLSRQGIHWGATPGRLLDTNGAAGFEGFLGRWNVKGIPSRLDADWSLVGGVMDVDLSHNGAPITLIDVEATANITEQAPASYVKVYAEGVPRSVVASGDSAELRFDLQLTDGAGSPASAAKLEVAYVADASQRLPVRSTNAGVFAYVRLREQQPSEMYARMDGVSAASLSGAADPENEGHRLFRLAGAEGSAAMIDFADDAGMSLVVKIDALPAEVKGRFLMQPATGDYRFLSESTGPIGNVQIDAVADGRQLRATTNLAKRTEVDTRFGKLLVSASPEALSFDGTYAKLGEPVAPQGIAGDYAFADLSSAGGRMAARVTGVTLVRADPGLGRYTIERVSANPLHLDVSLTEGLRIHGDILGLPSKVDLAVNLTNGAGSVDWRASARTTALQDIRVHANGQAWELDATNVPAGFHARGDLGAGSASLSTYDAGGWADATGFGTLRVGYAGDPSMEIPTLAGKGFHADFSQGQGAQHARLRVDVDGLKRLHVDRSPDVYLYMERSTSGEAFTGSYRLPDKQFDVRVGSMPAKLEATVDVGSPFNGTFADIDAYGTPLGAVSLSYREGAFGIEANATGLPDSVRLLFNRTVDANGGLRTFYVDYAGGSVSGGVPTLRGSGRTPDGMVALFDLTQIPRAFHAKVDKAVGKMDFVATSGSLSGTLYASPKEAVPAPPPAGWLGGSVSVENATEHVYLKVQGLEEAHWTTVGKRDEVRLRLAGDVATPHRVRVVKPDLNATLSLSGVPSDVEVDLELGDTHTEARYVASGTVGWAVLQAELRQKEVSHSISARITNVPAIVELSLDAPSGNIMVADLISSGGPSTRVAFSARDSTGRFVVGEVHGVPETAHVYLDPDANMGNGRCALDATASSSIDYVSLMMGRGKPKRGFSEVLTTLWARDGSEWAVVDVRDPAAPSLDITVRDVQRAKVCFADGLVAEAKLAGGAEDLRIYYQNSTSFVRARLDGVSVGEYKVEAGASGIVLCGGAIASVDASGRIPWELPFFEREIELFQVKASGIPSCVTADFVGNKITLDSHGGVLGLLDVSLHVGPSRRPEPSWEELQNDLLRKGFVLDGDRFQVDTLLIQVSETGQVRFRGEETHRGVFRTRDGFEMGIDMAQFRGGYIDFWFGQWFPHVHIENLKVQPSTGARFYASVPPDAAFPVVSVSTDDTPTTLTLRWNFVLTKWEAEIIPSERIEHMTVFGGQDDEQGTELTLTGIEPDGVLKWDLQAGSAFRFAVKFHVSGISLTYRLDATHYIRMSGGESDAFSIEGDVDGAQDYEGFPRLLDLTMPGSSTIDFEIRWGDNGIAFSGLSLEVVEVAMVAVKLVGGAVDFVVNGVEDVDGFLKAVYRDLEYLAPGSIW